MLSCFHTGRPFWFPPLVSEDFDKDGKLLTSDACLNCIDQDGHLMSEHASIKLPGYRLPSWPTNLEGGKSSLRGGPKDVERE
jgi:hypothetical protein